MCDANRSSNVGYAALSASIVITTGHSLRIPAPSSTSLLCTVPARRQDYKTARCLLALLSCQSPLVNG